MAFVNNLTVDNLNFNDKNNTFLEKITSYNNSKLALLIASDIFAEKLEGTGVTSNSIHPGFVSTPIFTKGYSVINNGLIKTVMRLYNWIYSKVITSFCLFWRGLLLF